MPSPRHRSGHSGRVRILEAHPQPSCEGRETRRCVGTDFRFYYRGSHNAFGQALDSAGECGRAEPHGSAHPPLNSRRALIDQVTPWDTRLMDGTDLAVLRRVAIGGQHRAPLQAVGHHPGTHRARYAELVAKAFPPGVLDVLCGDAGHRSRRRGPSDAPDGVDHRIGGRGPRRGGQRGWPPQAHAPRTRRQGAGDRVQTTPISLQPHRASRPPAISTRARTARPPPGCWRGHMRRTGDLTDASRRRGPGRHHHLRQTRRRRGRYWVLRARQQRRPDGPGAAPSSRTSRRTRRWSSAENDRATSGFS